MAWDQKPVPNDKHEDDDTGPYSITTVNDTAGEATEAQNSTNMVPYVMGIVALVLGAFAVARTVKK